MKKIKKSLVCATAVSLFAVSSLGAMPLKPFDMPFIAVNSYGADEDLKSGDCGEQGDNLKWNLDSEGVLTITGEGNMKSWDFGESPWFSRTDIKKVVIENGVTSIGNFAFEGCSDIVSATIPEGVTNIGISAFGRCEKLASVTLPKTVTSLENAAFESCESLTSFTFPEGVLEIGDNVLQFCYNLKTVELPASVESMGTGVFSYCTSLTEINVDEKK